MKLPTESLRGMLVVAVVGGQLFTGLALRAEEALPKRDPDERPNEQPALFLESLDLPLGESAEIEEPVDPGGAVARARADVERAQRKQQRWQQLAKKGILAQVEAESAVLQTAAARSKYEQARLAQQQFELTALRQRAAAGQVTADAVTAAESALRTVQAMAEEAARGLQRTRLLLAETNLDRQRRLVLLGSGSKNQVKRSEQAVQRLKGE